MTIELSTSDLLRFVAQLGLVQAAVSAGVFLLGFVPFALALGAIVAGGMLIGGAAIAGLVLYAVPIINPTAYDFLPDRDQCYNCREHSLDPPEDLGVFVECPECGSENLR